MAGGERSRVHAFGRELDGPPSSSPLVRRCWEGQASHASAQIMGFDTVRRFEKRRRLWLRATARPKAWIITDFAFCNTGKPAGEPVMQRNRREQHDTLVQDNR